LLKLLHKTLHLILTLHYYYYTINPTMYTIVKICDDSCSRSKRCEIINQRHEKKVNSKFWDFWENFDTFKYRFNMFFF